MKLFLTTIVCRLRLAVTPALLAALLLLVVFLSFVTAAFGERQTLRMNVGLFYPDTAYAADLAGQYEQYAAETVAVVRYSELPPMLRDVENGRLECAYILPDAYTRDGQIELIVTPDTVGEGVSNVLMASTYMRAMAADLGYKVLKGYVDGSRQEISSALVEKNEAYLERGAFMEIAYRSQKSGANPPANTLTTALNGTVALFALLFTLLFCLGLVHENQTAIAMRLRLIGAPVAYFLGNIAAVFLLNLLFFAAARVAISGFGDSAGLPVVLIYAFFISALGVTLGGAVKSESLFIGLIIVGFLSTAVLGGVFVDIGGLVPALDWTKYCFVTYYFMEGLRGSAAYLLLAAAALVLIGGFALKKRWDM